MADVDTAVLAFKILGERLRREGADTLRRELDKAINDAARPAVADVYRDLPAYMPNRYARVLGSDMRIALTKNVVRNPGVRIQARERDMRSVERRRLHRLARGTLAHPLFGNREHWFYQPIRPFFFAEPIEHQAPHVRDAIVDAMATVADKLTRKA